MDTDLDPWAPPLLEPDPVIHFDPDHPGKTITLAMAEHMLQRQYKANPGSFANKAADAFKACTFTDGSEDKNEA